MNEIQSAVAVAMKFAEIWDWTGISALILNWTTFYVLMALPNGCMRIEPEQVDEGSMYTFLFFILVRVI